MILILFPVFALLVPTYIDEFIPFAIVYIVLIIVFHKKIAFFIKSNKINRNDLIKGFAADFMLSIFFFCRWRESIKLAKWANFISVKPTFLLFVITLIIFISSLYGIIIIIKIIQSITTKSNHNNNATHNKERIVLKEYLFIALAAFMAITICSKSSPIYPFNDWVDANCFFTVGKSMWSGVVTYRDIYEQKGPLLYMLHALASLVSYDSFIGVYFLELISSFFFLLYAYKILLLFFDKDVIVILPIFAMIVYTVPAFKHGDSAEELFLPLFAYGLYVSMKVINAERKINKIELTIIGITSSMVLWIKFNLLGFYIGWIIIPIYTLIKKKDYHQVVCMLLYIGLGVLIGCIPIITYFFVNNSLKDLYTCYFYNNLFLYSKFDMNNGILNIIDNLGKGFDNILSTNHISFILSILGIDWLYKKTDSHSFYHVIIVSLFMFFFIYFGGAVNEYYCYDFCLFGIFGVCLLVDIFWKYINKINKKYYLYIVLTSSLLCFLLSRNTYLLKYSKSDLPQYKVKEVIEKSGIENPTLLNYGFLDGGFYTTSRIVPNQKYFCRVTIPLEEMYIAQDKSIQNGLTDFVVTRDEKINSDNYEEVGSYKFFFEIKKYKYYLYKKISK